MKGIFLDVANQIRCPRFADTSMTDFDFEKLVVAVDIWNCCRMQKRVYIHVLVAGVLALEAPRAFVLNSSKPPI